jgi:hypothetical protein
MDYYEDVAGPQLADEFNAELRLFFQRHPIIPNPSVFVSTISNG